MAVAEPVVGSKVRVTTSTDEVVEGVVYSYVPEFSLLMLKRDLAHTITNCAMHVFTMPHVRSIEVLEKAIDDPQGFYRLPSVSEAEVSKKEEKALKDAERLLAQLNLQASPEGQQIFDALAKTMDCEWQDRTIIVYGQVAIHEPYDMESCRSLDGKAVALARVVKVLGEVRQKL
ncbi:unnamed protein product, partial [Phaeothamnion confervicola]